ncbi:MAG: BadF/BadG/BcrA/BcrD ATPase family protein [Plesiomonas sp.]
MSDILFVGVDGGGTSCRARIRDQQGNTLGEGHAGSANILLGAEIAMQSVQHAIGDATQQAGLSVRDYQRMHVCFALAGAEHKSAQDTFNRLPTSYARQVLITDALAACLGAWGGNDGAVLIAGTGSCGLIYQHHQITTLGGHEFPISDQGSGARLGLACIQQALLSIEGITAASTLAEAIFSQFDLDIDSIVSWSKTARPRDYAAFSPMIFQFAAQGDYLAHQLLNSTARDIEMLLDALHKKGDDNVALMGSIGKYIQPWLQSSYQARLQTPKQDAIDGAILYAQQHLAQSTIMSN